MKRLTRVVLVVALAVGLLWVMWQAVDRTAWEDAIDYGDSN
jgi:hypothetical protein